MGGLRSQRVDSTAQLRKSVDFAIDGKELLELAEETARSRRDSGILCRYHERGHEYFTIMLPRPVRL
jgi:hypothetical protein